MARRGCGQDRWIPAPVCARKSAYAVERKGIAAIPAYMQSGIERTSDGSARVPSRCVFCKDVISWELVGGGLQKM